MVIISSAEVSQTSGFFSAVSLTSISILSAEFLQLLAVVWEPAQPATIAN
jgi:hypothetical protein